MRPAPPPPTKGEHSGKEGSDPRAPDAGETKTKGQRASLCHTPGLLEPVKSSSRVMVLRPVP